jgi:hypothetical protein
MSLQQLPIYVRYRWCIFIIGNLAFALGSYQSSEIFGVLFIWLSGLFFAIELFYPHRQTPAPSKLVSRMETASQFMRAYTYVGFTMYFLIACCFTYHAIKQLFIG